MYIYIYIHTDEWIVTATVLQHDPYYRLESEKAVLLNEMQQIRSKAVGSLQNDLCIVITWDGWDGIFIPWDIFVTTICYTHRITHTHTLYTNK